jgi:hypothetical protein
MNDPKEDLRPRVFVSHIHEEAALGQVVKDELQDAFAQRIAVFVSSDRRDNPGGERWLQKLERELKHPQTRMLISLVSPASVSEPWISIELGAAWILGHAVFPLCHTGQELSNLPRLLGDFGGADLARDDASERIIGAVEKAVHLEIPKKWARKEFLESMRMAAGQVVAKPAEIHGVGTVTRNTAALATNTDLPAEQIKILRMLAMVRNRGGDGDIPESEAPRESGIKPAVFTFHVKELEKRDLAHVSYYAGQAHYKLGPPGAGWLIAHNEMPD